MALGVRSYGNSLLLQNVFDLGAIPSEDLVLYAFAEKVLNPVFNIVEPDCGTLLGRRVQLVHATLGDIELGAEVPVTTDRLNELITLGETSVRTRDMSSCISTGGVCASCVRGTLIRRELPLPALDSIVKIPTTARSAQNYIANSYSGSLLGYEPIDSDPLPGYPALWDKITSHKEMDSVCRRLKDFKISVDELEYLYGIEDVLERALAIIAFYGVYASVQIQRRGTVE